MNALIIDDEKDICVLLSRLLKKKQIDNRYVNSLTDAKSELTGTCPALIFLDNHLPDGKGVDFVPHIKSHCASTVVVMITAYDSADDKREAVSKGVDVFISKPFTSEVIFHTLEKLTR